MRFQNLYREESMAQLEGKRVESSAYYINSHCYDHGTYCHSGLRDGKSIGKDGAYDVMDTAIWHLCLHQEFPQDFYKFVDLYRNYCFREEKFVVGPSSCTN